MFRVLLTHQRPSSPYFCTASPSGTRARRFRYFGRTTETTCLREKLLLIMDRAHCSNGFGVLTSAGGSKLRWWVSAAAACSCGVVLNTKIDPLGASIIAVCIIFVWARTAYGKRSMP
jgi:hypothetical protein